MRGKTAKFILSKFNKRSGFTLVELLVVISIIAVLSTIVFMNYQQVVKKGRDAKRQSDLRAIQSALEQYRTDAFTYPPSGGTNGLTFGQPLTYTPTSGTAKTYIKIVPQDPLNRNPNIYSYSPNGTNDYCLYATLEGVGTTTNFSPGCTNASLGNFSVSKP